MRRATFLRSGNLMLVGVGVLMLTLISLPGISLGANANQPAKQQRPILSGFAVQGPMSGATVTAYAVNPKNASNGEHLGSVATKGDGSFALTLKTMPRGPIRLTATGGNFASEEDAMVIANFSSISVLLANVKGDMVGISINPLTEFVDSLATGMLGKGHSKSLATTLSNARQQIERFYGLESDPAGIQPAYTKAAIGVDSGIMGLALGALIDEDQRLCNEHPGGLVGALSADIGDGFYDGLRFGKKINYCGAQLIAIAGTVAYQDALSGLHQLRIIPANPFMRGGKGNPLTTNDVPAELIIDSTTFLNSAIVQAVPPPENRFAMHAPTMNFYRFGATATLLRNGRVLLAGGENVDGRLLPSTELYDPIANCFAGNTGTPCAPRSAPSMNVGRTASAASILPNGKVLIVGGVGEGAEILPLASSELYSPLTNTFTVSPPTMFEQRVAPTATLLPNGKVLVAGGWGDDLMEFSNHRTAELYDPIANSFAFTHIMNQGRSFATATALLDGRVLIAGGLTDSLSTIDASVTTASVELYDPESDGFVPLAPPNMNVARSNAAAALLPNGKVLIAGGVGDDQRTSLASVEIYDPDAYAFEASTPSMNFARSSPTATLLPNGKVLIAGGTRETDDDITFPFPVELYDPDTNSFSMTPPSMNRGHRSPTATLLLSGRVLVAGGTVPLVEPFTDAADVVDLYTP